MYKPASAAYVFSVTSLAALLGGVLFESTTHFGVGPQFPYLFIIGSLFVGGAGGRIVGPRGAAAGYQQGH